MQFLTRLIGYILAAGLGLVAVLLMVGSRDPAVIKLALINGSVELPLFAAILAAWLIGFFCGVVIMWFCGGRWRDLARDEMVELDAAQTEIADLKQELAKVRADADRAEATHGDALAGNDNRQVALLPGRAL
jgi:hypothetical protein